MGLIIVHLVFTVFNILMGFWNYDMKNYKTAMYSMFAAGICFMGFLNSLMK